MNIKLREILFQFPRKSFFTFLFNSQQVHQTMYIYQNYRICFSLLNCYQTVKSDICINLLFYINKLCSKGPRSKPRFSKFVVLRESLSYVRSPLLSVIFTFKFSIQTLFSVLRMSPYGLSVKKNSVDMNPSLNFTPTFGNEGLESQI